MLPKVIHYPAAYYNGHAFFYERASGPSPSHFGGPTNIRFTGVVHGPRRLHHMMTLHRDAIPGIEKEGFSELSLFYGMCYSGCTMAYEIGEGSNFHLLELDPSKSSADW